MTALATPDLLTANRRRDLRESLAALALAGPAGALILVFLVGPLVCIALLSLTDYQLGAKTLRWIGLTTGVGPDHGLLGLGRR